MNPTVLEAIDPWTGRPTGRVFPQATVDEVDAALASAQQLHVDGALRPTGLRSALLKGSAARLREVSAELIACCEMETGLTPARLDAELQRACKQLEAFARVVDEGHYVEATIDHGTPQGDIRRVLMPIGPVAVFGASNFPLAFGVGGGDTASALAAGCPVVIKGHPLHPATSAIVARELSFAAQDAGVSANVVALLQIDDIGLAERIVDSPHVHAVAFTGSHRAGRAIFDRAARRPQPIPVYAEMSSVNPILITTGALRARGAQIAKGLAASVAGSAGQLCTKPGIVLIPDDVGGGRFTAAVAGALDAAPAGPMLSPDIRTRFRSRVEELGRLGLDFVTAPRALDTQGFVQAPSAWRARAADVVRLPELLDEHFGPAVGLVAYDSLDDVRAVVDQLPGQLTATLYSEADERAELQDILEALTRRSGRLIFDGFPTGVAVVPAMHHGGPYPATTSGAHTSVGSDAIRRFLRPAAYQDAPHDALPPALRDENPLGLWRLVDGEMTQR